MTTAAPLLSLDHASEAGPGAACDLQGAYQTHILVARVDNFSRGLVEVSLELSLDNENWWDAPYSELSFVAGPTAVLSSSVNQPSAIHDVAIYARYSRAVIKRYESPGALVTAWVEATG